MPYQQCMSTLSPNHHTQKEREKEKNAETVIYALIQQTWKELLSTYPFFFLFWPKASVKQREIIAL